MVQQSFDSSLICTELGRFFEVAAEYRRETGNSAMMPACVVDTAWHDIQRDRKALRELIDKHLGTEMEVAHLKKSGRGRIDWVELYERHFGKLPLPWFTEPDGSVDRDALELYERTGEVRLSWDCTPKITERKKVA